MCLTVLLCLSIHIKDDKIRTLEDQLREELTQISNTKEEFKVRCLHLFPYKPRKVVFWGEGRVFAQFSLLGSIHVFFLRYSFPSLGNINYKMQNVLEECNLFKCQ